MRTYHNFKSHILIVVVWLYFAGTTFAQVQPEAMAPGVQAWGKAAHGLKVGLNFYRKEGSSGFFPVLVQDGSIKDGMLIYLPPKQSLFRVALWDERGNLVPKTANSEPVGKPLIKPLSVRSGINFQAGYAVQYIGPDWPEFLTSYSFEPKEYFAITKPGRYRLAYEMIVVWFPPSWEGDPTKVIPPTITLPQVEVDFDVLGTNANSMELRPLHQQGSQ